jgi:hypothetical protein
VTRIVLELDGEPRMVLRVLKSLLRRLLRDHAVRCRGIWPESNTGDDHG